MVTVPVLALFIAFYPHAGAFLEMVTDPVYRQAVVHRQAATGATDDSTGPPAPPTQGGS